MVAQIFCTGWRREQVPAAATGTHGSHHTGCSPQGLPDSLHHAWRIPALLLQVSLGTCRENRLLDIYSTAFIRYCTAFTAVAASYRVAEHHTCDIMTVPELRYDVQSGDGHELCGKKYERIFEHRAGRWKLLRPTRVGQHPTSAGSATRVGHLWWRHIGRLTALHSGSAGDELAKSRIHSVAPSCTAELRCYEITLCSLLG